MILDGTDWDNVAEQIEAYDNEWFLMGMVGNRTWFREYSSDKLRKLIYESIPKIKLEKALDVGCGIGQWSVFLSTKLSTHFIGVDMTRKFIELAKKRAGILKNDNVEFFEMQASNLKFEDNSFDLTMCVTVLQHIIDTKTWEAVIKEMVRVTKSGGYVLICEDAPSKFNGERIKRNGYIHLESEYISEFLKNGAVIESKKGVYNLISTIPLRIGEYLLDGYARRIDKINPDFYSADFNGYKPKLLYIPCMLCIQLAKIVDAVVERIHLLKIKEIDKIIVFKKTLVKAE